MRISDWSSDVCSSDLFHGLPDRIQTMSETTAPIRIDFVSDVSCPWCAIGLQALEQASARVGEDASVALQFQPFELNRALAAGGGDPIEHLTAKDGMSAQEQRANGGAQNSGGASGGITFGQD